ncbi:oxygenase MpaB family protein [Tsukamurella serpentis]
MAKAPRNTNLDPEVDYLRIYRDLTTLDFPWDFNQALSFALFRTYAVPSIGGLLHRTGEFEQRPQKRYDDTALLLEVPLLNGLDHPEGRAAVRRINQMHRSYDISNDDMLYVLSTFVVVPKRWIDCYGWRKLTAPELRASVLYYRELGKHMGIRAIPQDYLGFATLMDDYESRYFAYDQGGRMVADATRELLASFYPPPLAPLLDLFSRAVMDEPLLRAFHYRRPSPVVRFLAVSALKLRAAVVAKMPARREPQHVYDMPRIKTYPRGFTVEQMGTFPTGCPVGQGSVTR